MTGARIAAVLSVVLLGCAAPADQQPVAVATPMDVKSAPPTPKQAIQLFLRNQDVPMTVDSSCAGVGTSFDDKTIGDYASGFLAEFTSGKNEIAAECAEGSRQAGAVDTWACQIEWRHQDGEDVWAWGVRFSVRAADGEFLRSSVRCIGGG